MRIGCNASVERDNTVEDLRAIVSEESELIRWGWTPSWESRRQKPVIPGQKIARVVAVFREKCLLRTAEGELIGEVTGQFRHMANEMASFPVVGDWALVEMAGPDSAMVHQLLPRKTALSRKVAGRVVREQMFAANVDVVFVMTAFDEDFNVRRLERYIVMARQAGMDPVVLLNKSDLAGEDDVRLGKARDVNPNGAVHRLSAKTGEGIDIVKFYLNDGKTGIFLGSSGVGKSTLLNALMGDGIQKTQPIRSSDGKGRHTTTTRQMFLLPSGGLVIDTPGLREIQLWADESALTETFTDIADLAKSCRYDDCKHGPEPGCAVTKAIETGILSPARYAGYLKLQKEVAYLQSKQDPSQRGNMKRRWKSRSILIRDYYSQKIKG